MDTQNKFLINARTCTLRHNTQENGGIILDNRTGYIIPVYQRPYSWTEEQIRRFVSDIFYAYWGNGDSIIEEPMFIGTMQLSYKNRQNEQEVIDGQQRLTTLLILIKVLKQKFPENEALKNVDLTWLRTRVNNEQQQQYLEELLTSDYPFTSNVINPYLKNAFLVMVEIDKAIADDNQVPFEISRFINHIFSNIYFAVIETRAGLSKTLQIFNAINTTGLDLNGGDIFKIRMYEYLKDKKGKDETAFEEINDLYKKIDVNNSALGYVETDIRGILTIYQFVLIAKYNLPVTLYSYGSDTFFERLFDTLLI